LQCGFTVEAQRASGSASQRYIHLFHSYYYETS
jgi:hypothetical protein